MKNIYNYKHNIKIPTKINIINLNVIIKNLIDILKNFQNYLLKNLYIVFSFEKLFITFCGFKIFQEI